MSLSTFVQHFLFETQSLFQAMYQEQTMEAAGQALEKEFQEL